MNHEIVRFFSAGLANTAASYLLYLLLLYVLPYAASYTLAYAAGIALSYILNSLFVFRRPVALKKALSFPAVYVVQYVLSVLLLRVAVDVFGVEPRLAPLPVVALTVPVTFLLSRVIIRGRPRNALAAVVPAGDVRGGESREGRFKRAAGRYLFNAGLMVLAAAGTVLLAEVALRFTVYGLLIGRDTGAPRNYYVVDRENGYDIKPGHGTQKFDFRDSSHPIWSNELGCFDTPYGGEDPSILLLGDSTSWGYKPFEMLWGSVLERETGVRVLKCAVPGYGTKHEILKGRKVIDRAGRSPSVILVGHCVNDPIDDYLHPFYTVVDGHMLAYRNLADVRSGEIGEKSVDSLREELQNWERFGVTYTPRHPTLKRIKKFLSERSIVYRLTQPHCERLLRGIPSLVPLAEALIDPPAFPPEDYLRILYQPGSFPWLDKAWEAHFENLKGLKRLAEDNGAKIVIVLIPTREQVYGFDGKSNGVRGDEVHEKLIRFLEQQKIPALDLLPAFRRYAEEASKAKAGDYPPLYWRRDSHGGPEADRLLGLLVARHLIEEGVVDVPDAEGHLGRIDGALERVYMRTP
jgi:putative flippase GtrA